MSEQGQAAETISERIQEARGARTWKEIARAAGVGRRTLEEVRYLRLTDERGRGKRGPSLDTLQRIAGVLGVNVGWLAFGEGPRERV